MLPRKFGTLSVGLAAEPRNISAAVVPVPAQTTTKDAGDCTHTHGAPLRMSWARLLKRVFGIDIEHCAQCGRRLKIIAVIEAPPAIERILTHLGCRHSRRPERRRGGLIC